MVTDMAKIAILHGVLLHSAHFNVYCFQSPHLIVHIFEFQLLLQEVEVCEGENSPLLPICLLLTSQGPLQGEVIFDIEVINGSAIGKKI